MGLRNVERAVLSRNCHGRFALLASCAACSGAEWLRTSLDVVAHGAWQQVCCKAHGPIPPEWAYVCLCMSSQQHEDEQQKGVWGAVAVVAWVLRGRCHSAIVWCHISYGECRSSHRDCYVRCRGSGDIGRGGCALSCSTSRPPHAVRRSQGRAAAALLRHKRAGLRTG